MTTPVTVPPAPPVPTGAFKVPDPPKIKEIENLIPPSLLFREGKGGLKVAPAPGGVMLVMFDKKGMQRRFNAQAKKFIADTLSQRYPSLSFGAVFGKEGERERLVLGMRSRLNNVVGRPPGDIVGLESLDPDTKRVIPSDPALLTPDDHKTLPRHLTWVQLKPEPARRYIAISEKQIPVNGKKLRPDEVFISYEIGTKEIAEISDEITDASGNKIRVTKTPPVSFTTLGDVETKNLRIHVGDPNLEIGGKRATDHFKKTLSYLKATLETLTEPGAKPRLIPVGKVYLSARDVYKSPAFLKLSGNGAKVARWVKDLSSLATDKNLEDYMPKLSDNSVIHLEAVFERAANGVWGPVQQASRTLGRLGKTGATGIKTVLKETLEGDTVDKLLKVLKEYT